MRSGEGWLVLLGLLLVAARIRYVVFTNLFSFYRGYLFMLSQMEFKPPHCPRDDSSYRDEKKQHRHEADAGRATSVPRTERDSKDCGVPLTSSCWRRCPFLVRRVGKKSAVWRGGSWTLLLWMKKEMHTCWHGMSSKGPQRIGTGSD